MTTPEPMELHQRLNRASMRRFTVGIILAVAVTVAGLAQPARTYPPEVTVPSEKPMRLHR